MARFIRKSQFQAACEDIRSALSLTSDQTTYLTKPKQELEPDEAYYADRTFHGGKTSNYSRTRSTYSKGQNEKKCFICGKTGCWSTRHTGPERKEAYKRFKKTKSG